MSLVAAALAGGFLCGWWFRPGVTPPADSEVVDKTRPRDEPVQDAVSATVVEEPRQVRGPKSKYMRSMAEYPIPDVELIASTGHRITLPEALRHEGPVVMQFVFTTCPTICPVMAGAFGRLQDLLRDDLPRVRLVSVSIDPEYDTPVRLREFAASVRATEHWKFYTGTRRNIIAVQKAFGVYEGNKMYHRPLTLLRGASTEHWVRIDGMLSAEDLLAECRPLLSDSVELQEGDVELGRRIYQDGVLSNGAPLMGVAQGDISIEGKNLRCANCHRKSGFATAELATYVPPITSDRLFRPRDDAEPDLIRRMFQEIHPKPTHARVRDPRVRPAYSDESLSRVIRRGMDPAERELSTLMPRYQIGDQDMRHLVAYMKSLAAEPPQGIDRNTIHFATVVVDGSDADSQDAMRSVIDAYVRRKNADIAHKLDKPYFSPEFKSNFIGAYRSWNIHTWRLKGDGDSWGRQLEEYYRQQPVFALVSGIGFGKWRPVHEFCERQQLPCLFPQTDLPDTVSPNDYTLYFSKGLRLEAEVLAEHLVKQQVPDEQRTVIQVLGDALADRVAAETLRNRLADFTGIRVEDRILDGTRTLSMVLEESLSQPVTLVLWLGPDHIRELENVTLDNASEIYISHGLAGENHDELSESVSHRIRLVYPYALPGREPPRIYRLRAWMRSRGVKLTHPRLQLNTFFALSITDHALMHLLEDYSRDYLIESIEHETENWLNAGNYPHLSLGPGQRFASRGAYIVQLNGGAKPRLEPVGNWIVPE